MMASILQNRAKTQCTFSLAPFAQEDTTTLTKTCSLKRWIRLSSQSQATNTLFFTHIHHEESHISDSILRQSSHGTTIRTGTGRIPCPVCSS